MSRSATGFTLFEFAVCLAVTLLLMGGLLRALSDYRAESEQVAVKQLLASVRTAMAARAAREVNAGGAAALDVLARENPISWLASVPENYLGEFYRPAPELLKEGYWYFDRTDRSINFVQRNDTFTLETSKLLKFKVELLREPVPNRSGGRTEATQGLVFGQVYDRIASNNH